MPISLFDMFKVGIGPSSSHTVGPMRAAYLFVKQLIDEDKLQHSHSLRCELYGSLGATGVGHGTGPAVMLGLEGFEADNIDPQLLVERTEAIERQKQLMLGGTKSIAFDSETALCYLPLESRVEHPNAMKIVAFSEEGGTVLEKTYFSIGGGFVTDKEQFSVDSDLQQIEFPYSFSSAEELLSLCRHEGMSISEIALENEKYLRGENEVRRGVLTYWQVMKECVQRGLLQEGVLPGGLNVKRRAPSMLRALNSEACATHKGQLGAMEWVNLYALAVNEENASGGRVVTAPTNGAAGIIPAVLHYYVNFCDGANEEGVIRFLLTASAIGSIIKVNASISGAEVGCQGEVGSACAMAAAGLAEVLGATPEQVENAAEIGMEHNLGLTCDPIGGLVQVPCIERNAMASVKAINAASIAMRGNGEHFVSLDCVIRTMRETGKDMMDKYKETSRGGLAINVIEC
ncbi:L-serine ammonia-lyase [Vibrio sp. nBUS_14]|uniref:L-serine ammonia-lyase n=1 Tax=Vibrio sp. nBUS_14 TaxID=3395321 RepID=UPI003EC0A765